MDTITKREEQIFVEALELEFSNDREQFVRDRCGEDHELRDRVLELLKFHDKTGNILDATTDGLLAGNTVKDDTIRAGVQKSGRAFQQDLLGPA